MKKIVSIRTKNSWLGVGIFIAFIILQITIGYRISMTKESIEKNHEIYQKEVILQNIYIEFLQYKNDKNKIHIDKIRKYLNTLGEPYRSRILSYLPNFEKQDQNTTLPTKLDQYLKSSIAKIKSDLKISDNLDITKENIIMFIIILIINIIINLALYIFAKRIINNIDILQNGLVTFFEYLNRNISNPTKLNINSNDEFEVIADIINKNIEKIEKDLQKDKECVEEIRNVVHSMSEGDFSYRIHSNPANPEIAELKKSLNTFLDEIQKLYSTILSVLENYKQEDYTPRVSLKAKGEIEVLIDGVNKLGDSLSNSAQLIAKSLAEKSEVLQETSNKLTENIDELSKTLSQTNKNIDIATNQIDDIMQAIESTVHKTNQMKEVANKTSDSAQKGQKLAENTLNAMQEIYSSTNDISEAISVIDSIAFQTNILSLNAAVEAATAGEAGKGFAVVAQEVRNLANKSAEAAKKIKELVSKTQVKSTEGIEISENMKENFLSVVKNVSNTLGLVNSVANEADGEMKKIESINKLIKDIDEMTNQNKVIMQNTYVVTYDLSKISNELYEQVKNKKFVSDN
ncbi:methyl-accepting chemotaxis protein [Hydrogenimonas thermophila]|uniref:Methyl-accepting chemotaxis protein n=1 Tax=Hydrogenimonas thermophila TaxID=223786 RepID=A0A1I5KU94_9BACT|nr:methyl-accepting chemotaxis protein [Hydrogenimonas thermophila]SFO88577.1 methyl-accepting chemotaxis protein [Hydrogenimonas thermophila]